MTTFNEKEHLFIHTLQKPTSVIKALKANLLPQFPNDTQLLIIKRHQIEVYQPLTHQLLLQSNFNGILVDAYTFPKGKEGDVLILLTNRLDIIVLQLKSSATEPIHFETLISGHLSNPSQHPQKPQHFQSCLDIENGVLLIQCLHSFVYMNTFDFKHSAIQTKILRLKEWDVRSICFLNELKTPPTLAILYQDSEGGHKVSTYILPSMQSQEVMPKSGMFQINHLGEGSHFLYPLPKPIGGCLIFGSDSISYVNAFGQHLIHPVSDLQVCALCCISELVGEKEWSYLLGDQEGRLFRLMIRFQQQTTGGLQIEQMALLLLGTVSIPSSMVYFSKEYIYVGSHYSDSQLISITEQNTVQVERQFVNIAPIVDLALIRRKNQQSLLVTCSGSKHQGTLRLIQNGVNVKTVAVLEEIGSASKVYTLCTRSHRDSYYLVLLSYPTESKVLMMDPKGQFHTIESMFEKELLEESVVMGHLSQPYGFVLNQPTLLISQILEHGLWIQVTKQSVRVISMYSKLLAGEWFPPVVEQRGLEYRQHIVLAEGIGGMICVGMSDGLCVLLELKMEVGRHWEILKRGERRFSADFSALAMSRVGGEWRVVVGLWTNSVVVMKGTEMDVCQEIQMNQLVRSLLLSGEYLFCGFGDGLLQVYQMIDGEYRMKEHLQLGTYPLTLQFITGPTTATQKQYILVQTPHAPTLITTSSTNNQSSIKYTPLNMNGLLDCAVWHNHQYMNTFMILQQSNQLSICEIDLDLDRRELGIETIYMNEEVRRVAFLPPPEDTEMGWVGCLTVSTSSSSEEWCFLRMVDVCGWRLLDAPHDSYQMLRGEYVCSIHSFAIEHQWFLFVGTAFIKDGEMEPKRGRVLQFQYKKLRGLDLVSVLEVQGAVYSMTMYREYLCIGVNSFVLLYQYKNNKWELRGKHKGHVLVLLLKTRGDLLLVGDLIKGVSLFRLVELEDRVELEEVGRDYCLNWTTSSEFIQDGSVLVGDKDGNLLVCGGEGHLSSTAYFHLGDMVNTMIPESLLSGREGILMATVSGALYQVFGVEKEVYEKLEPIQQALMSSFLIPSDRHQQLTRTSMQSLLGQYRPLGDLDRLGFRTFRNEKMEEKPRGILDGELLMYWWKYRDGFLKRVEDEEDLDLKGMVDGLEEVMQGFERMF